MTRHVILWQLKDALTETQKIEAKAAVKAGLEGLYGKVPGIVSIVVRTEGLADSSNADMMLDSTFETCEAYTVYRTHPAHVAVADGVVRPVVKTRLCLDWEE